ncbi:DUF3080 family protein [Congregibacter sp.]|uniref:DUF3080 family protein n=1 Tax=Congregibacter sp. TaxID=2744308 RepID=UPI003F6A8392
MPVLLLTPLLVLLAACSGDGQKAELENYLSRLLRPLDMEAPGIDRARSPMPPRAESLRIELDGSKLDGMDFLRLRGCALQQTVARRNSSLGRVAPPSQRLLLELAFLRDAPACIDTLRSDGKDELAAAISDSVTLKHSQLPALVFNATLGNSEYRDFWRTSTSAQNYPEQTSSEVITALEQLTAAARRWLSEDYDADDMGFELALSDIARGDGGELLEALARQAAYLDAANAVIVTRMNKGPLCRTNTDSKAAAIARTVVNKFFIREVQARAANLGQRYYALMGPLRELERLLADTLPDAYVSWRDRRDTLFDAGLEAPRNHVKQLQALLGVCYAEFAPKGENTTQ